MKKLNFKDNWAYFLCMIIGVVLTIVGILFLTNYKMYYGDYRAVTFGGDFYTEIHKATTSAVNTLRNIYELVRIGIGWCMIGVGVTEIVVCGSKLKFLECKDDNLASDGLETSIEET